MASNIDPERPNVGVPRLTKDGFEDNFTAAKDEIEDLQSRVTALEGGGGGFNVDQYDIAGRLTVGTGGLEAVDIATLTDQASPASTDDLLAKRASDGELVKIEVGNLPGGDVTSVFTRTGAVVAASDDYDDAQVTAAASATNYTPASSTVDGHLSGIDTALGTVGAVASVFTRTGAVVAVSGDYDADEIDETASNKIMTAAERTKLAGIETAATADQTGAEIKTAYEGEADTNAFTDAEQTKLSGIATGATDDTTVDAHIADAVAAHDDSAIAAAASATNYTPGGSTVEGHLSGIDTALGTVGAVASVFTRTGAVVAVSGDYDADEITETASNKIMTAAERTKLAGIETAATADQTNAEIKTAYEANADTNEFSDAEQTKLAGIETAATADQTGAEIKTAYEAEADTNAFTDAEQTKLSGIATGATDDTTVDAHIADATAAHAGTAIANTPAGGISATSVQAAIDELDSDKTDDTTVDAHIADAVAAHDDSAIAAAASATNYTPGASTVEGHLSGIDTALGTVGAVASVFSRTGAVVAVAGDYDDAEVTAAASATNYTPGAATVDGHLSGIDTALGTVGAVASVFSRTGVVVAVAGDYTASEVINVPAGDIVATTVQTAIDELDGEKVATSVTLTASTGLTGGGDLSANRSFAVDINGTSDLPAPATGDELLLSDISDTNTVKKADLASIVNLADHDALTNFVADEHVAHAGVTLTAGDGLSGGGTIAASRTFDVDIAGTTDLPSPAVADEILVSDASNADAIRKADVASVVNLADHDALTNFVSDEHVAHSGVTLTAGDGLSGGGDISSNRTFDVDINGTTDLAAPATGDEMLLGDISDSNNIRKSDVAAVLLLADHDAITNFVADEHIAHSGVTLTAGDGLSGGGTIAANRSFAVDISGSTDDATPARADELLMDDGAIKKSDIGAIVDLAKPLESFIIAASDKTTALTTGTNKSIPINMPYAFTVSEVRCNVQTAPTGAVLTVDINEAGTSILSTKLTIDVSERTSTTAATPAVISDSALADDAEITIDIDQIGSTIAGAGLVVTIIGRQT